MQLTNLELAEQFIYELYLWSLLVVGVIGLALGAGLVTNAPLIGRISKFMNRWVSLRHGTKWANVPRDTQPFVQRHRRVIGVVFVLVAASSLYSLIARVDADALAAFIGLDALNQTVNWFSRSVYLFLIAGNVFAVVTGMLLLVSPDALHGIETHANRWYSFRRVSLGFDNIHSELDGWVTRFPRASGLAIVVMTLIELVECGSALRALA